MTNDVVAWMAGTIRKLEQRIKVLEAKIPREIILEKLIPVLVLPETDVQQARFEVPEREHTSHQGSAPLLNPDAEVFQPTFVPSPRRDLPTALPLSAVFHRESALETACESREEHALDCESRSDITATSVTVPDSPLQTAVLDAQNTLTNMPPVHALEQLLDALWTNNRRDCYGPLETIVGSWELEYIDDEEHQEIYHLRDRIDIAFCSTFDPDSGDPPDCTVFADWLRPLLASDFIKTKAER